MSQMSTHLSAKQVISSMCFLETKIQTVFIWNVLKKKKKPEISQCRTYILGSENRSRDFSEVIFQIRMWI